jgi:hypothetical protein
MITLRWSSAAGVDVASYKIYRSIVGFKAPVLTPAELNGLTLQLRLNGSATQTIAFDGTTATVDLINSLISGGRAYLSAVDSDFFIFRSNTRTELGSVEIVGGTSLTLLGLTAREITTKSEDSLASSVTDAGEDSFTYIDYDGASDDWYAITSVSSRGSESVKTDYIQPDESAVASDGDAFNPRPKNYDLLVDADFIKEVFLFGVSLKNDDGDTMSDYLIEFYIRSAQEWLERELQILLRPTTIVNETHDYVLQDYTNFGFIKLNHLPVRRVSSVSMKFPVSSNSITFDDSWYKVDARNGIVNLVPTAGSFSTILMGQGGSFLPLLYNSVMSIPAIIEVDYEAGFAPGQCPPDILEVIGMKAALGPLNIAGDLIAGAGIANTSISLDGLSQSIGTTSSATNAGYGARVIQYLKQIDKALGALRIAYRGIQMRVA